MNIVVLGHLVLDEIRPFEGPVIESLGGIFFPVAAFGALAGRADLVQPCIPVGGDAWQSFLEAVSIFPQVDTATCVRLDDPNTRVRLFHDDKSEYNTQLVSSLPPIKPAYFLPSLPDADLVYVNFMTGEDLAIDSAEMIRPSTSALIYLDLHMIAYRVGCDGHRAPYPVCDWKRWVRTADIMQCNERELAALLPHPEGETERALKLCEEAGLRMLVVTKGARGATVHSKDACIHLKATSVAHVVDSTGCGDIFGATLAYFLASGCDPQNAGEKAAKAGAFAISIPGSHGMEKLRRAVYGVGA